jgi:hypothetical protein
MPPVNPFDGANGSNCGNSNRGDEEQSDRGWNRGCYNRIGRRGRGGGSRCKLLKQLDSNYETVAATIESELWAGEEDRAANCWSNLIATTFHLMQQDTAAAEMLTPLLRLVVGSSYR